MTSRNSFMAEQSELLHRRLWPIALSLLLPFLIFIIGEALVFSSQGNGLAYMETAEQILEYQNYLVRDYFSATNPLLLLTVSLLAIVLAMQGFAWIDSKRQLDFYESQPISRNHRFFQIHLNSFLIFWISYTLMALLGVLIVVAYGMPVRENLLFILRSYVQLMMLFYATYMMTILAVMLTGNILVACLACGVFSGYEFLLLLVLSGLMGTFSVGYTSDRTLYTDPITSPLFRALMAPTEAILSNLILGSVFFLLAYLAYTHRRNETAGSAVVFGFIRVIVKVALIFLGALITGLIGYDISDSSVVMAVLLSIFGGMIIGCVLEIIYHYDFKALFHGIAFHLLGIALALLVFFGFQQDLFGYSTWVPKPESVESVMLDYEDYYTDHYYENGSRVGPTSDFYRAYMHLTDIESVNELLKLGIETTRERQATQNDTKPNFQMVFEYKMKNGLIKRRRLLLPYDPRYAPLYDKIFGSDEFKQGYFQIYHDQFIQDHVQDLSIFYNNGLSEEALSKVDGTFYNEFNAAYLKDLAKFNYSLATMTPPIGTITLQLRESLDSQADGTTIYYPVYGSYDNTIAFLKSAGLWIDPPSTEKWAEGTYQAPFLPYFYRDVDAID